MTPFEPIISFAQQMDSLDELAGFKEAFHFPQHDGRDVIYFCGNSLGLQPRNVEAAIQQELESWKTLGVEGYFHGPNPWLYYHDYVTEPLAKLVGAQKQEVTVMNTLTVNLHLLMLSFYKPSGKRYKIMMEAGAFPSDQYAVETLLLHYGYNPGEAIIEVTPRENEKLLRDEDILQAIAEHGEHLALVLFGGINYYTGQLFNMAAITAAAHQVGAIAGFDLAHVTGNVPVQLHDWNVDFAVWCSYKYLNAGPGAIGGLFVHERHAVNTATPRLGGWWGNDEKTRFKMEKGFRPKASAGGWNISTAQVFNTVALKASLELFEKAGIDKLRNKSINLTKYLSFLLQHLANLDFEIITPPEPGRRGAQLCLYFKQQGRVVHDKLTANGIVADYREPGVIRVAPAPLYCSFEDCYRFYEIVKTI
ncbi:kynureninase [Foetidibacter luteolus]|uniref:kynureninase n=1 Tax=Foetidibacter luteolus TaxID=2608880 RepID=UPI00129BC579|nr:kynureninase [Foetidibacter luteolus]